MKRIRQKASRGSGRSAGGKEPLSYWRRIGPDSFNAAMRAKLAKSLRDITPASPEWRRALQGDVATACGLALKLKFPNSMGMQTDIAMTLLLQVAFENAAAALVMSYTLKRIPLPSEDSARLSALWSVHQIWLESRRRGSL
jgi:hypothetical protein